MGSGLIIAVAFMSGMFLGTLTALIIINVKHYIQKKNIEKNKEEYLELIKDEKRRLNKEIMEVKNAEREEGRSVGYERTAGRTGTNEIPVEPIEHKEDVRKPSRVQLPAPKFTLRD